MGTYYPEEPPNGATNETTTKTVTFQPVNSWREVCRWDVGETPLEERGIDYERAHAMQASEHSEEPHPLRVQMTAKEWEDQYWKMHKVTCEALDELEERRDLTDSLIACYEELAEEHRALQAILAEGIWVGDSVEKVVMPNPSEDQVSVRPYVRAKPRRSKLAAIEADHPTVQADPPAGEIGPLQGQGEASGRCGTCRHGEDSLTCLVCEDWSDYDTIPQSGEERSE